jgi:4a-hydroxytetrahydrobiopterin dehydratase
MNWTKSKNKLMKSFNFSDFTSALEFINNVGRVSEKLNHHPKITNLYNLVELELWTQSTNSVTELDYELAKEIDNLQK